MYRVGIECEQLEGTRFGVGHTLAKLLETIAKIPNVEKEFRFVLYFKKEMPNDAFLLNPLFETHILTGGAIPTSFNIFYHILLPIRYWQDKLDAFFFPSYMLPAFFIGRACVVLTNDVYWEAHHGNLPFRYRFSYRLFCWWAAKRARVIITISHFSAHELREFYHIPESRMIVNPWGIDEQFQTFERTKKYEDAIAKMKTKYEIAHDFFLSIGQAFPRRHIREAIMAFACIAQKYSNMQYLVACKDAHNPPVLENLIKESNQKIGRNAIIHTSYIEIQDLPYLMNEAKGLIYISDKEALGLPPLEALACNTPSIVKKNELSHEVLGSDGFFILSHRETNSFIKNSESIEEIAHTMEKILDNPQQVKDVIQKQKPFLKKLNWQEHAKKLLSVLETVARR